MRVCIEKIRNQQVGERLKKHRRRGGSKRKDAGYLRGAPNREMRRYGFCYRHLSK